MFVVADRQYVTRLLLIDFEGYLEENNYTYDYPTTATVNLGGQEYLPDAWVVTDEMLVQQRPDSDLMQIFRFVQEQGYSIPNAAIIQRFVRVVDETKRNELLICYMEDVTALGMTEADLAADERTAAQRENIIQDVREHAVASFTILST